MPINDDGGFAQFEDEQARVEAELRRTGVTWGDLAEHMQASNERPQHLPLDAKFFVMIPFGDLLAVLRLLPDDAGRDAFIAAMTHRSRGKADHSDSVA